MYKYEEIDLLTSITNGGALDIRFLLDKINKYANSYIDYNPDLDYLVKECKSSWSNLHINGLIYVVMQDIHYEIVNYFKKYANGVLKEKNAKRVCDYLDNFEFKPYVNCLDSWFNNWLDDVGIDKNKTWKVILKNTRQ